MTDNRLYLHREHETIVAVATASGTAAIGVVRLSGKDAVRIGRQVTQRESSVVWTTPRQAQVLPVYGAGQQLDQAVVTCFHGPQSYTGEDVVEFSLHGNPVLLREVIQACCEQGARLAEKGEFTFRAVLHGKLDLVQAEAVREMIEAGNRREIGAAMQQLHGVMSAELVELRDGLKSLWGEVEHELEFGEELLETVTGTARGTRLGELRRRLQAWEGEARRHRERKVRPRLVICGPPNVGKSTLFNALLGEERAIVTSRAGTTRDVVSAALGMQGEDIELMDTAGMHASEDEIESEGIRRAAEMIAAAEVIVLVREVQGNRQAERQAEATLAGVEPERIIRVCNKIDRQPEALTDGELAVSAKQGTGLNALRTVLDEAMARALQQRPEPGWMLSERQTRLLGEIVDAVQAAESCLLQDAPAEVASVELQAAVEKIHRLLGETWDGDLLGEIFAQFCVGK